jgi:uncharacterized membrane protein YfcA
MFYVITAFFGFFAGFLSGFFGIGGGVVYVPTLLFILRARGYSPGDAMLIATGTSLGAILFSTTSSAWRHRRYGNVRTETLIPILIGVVLTSAVGVLITNKIGGDPLRYLLAAFNLWASYRMFKKAFGKSAETGAAKNPLFDSFSAMPWKVKLFLFGLGIVVGVKSAMLGIGGGVFVVAGLIAVLGYPARNAAGTSAFVAFVAAVVGVIFRGILGEPPPSVPPGTVGTLNIPLALLMGIPAAFSAQLGAYVHKRIGERDLFFILFGILLLIVSAKMIF